MYKDIIMYNYIIKFKLLLYKHKTIIFILCLYNNKK
jgi:hypothetical protein